MQCPAPQAILVMSPNSKLIRQGMFLFLKCPSPSCPTELKPQLYNKLVDVKIRVFPAPHAISCIFSIEIFVIFTGSSESSHFPLPKAPSFPDPQDIKQWSFKSLAVFKCEVFAEFESQPIIKVNLLNDFQDVFAKIEISASASFNDY